MNKQQLFATSCRMFQRRHLIGDCLSRLNIPASLTTSALSTESENLLHIADGNLTILQLNSNVSLNTAVIYIKNYSARCFDSSKDYHQGFGSVESWNKKIVSFEIS